MTSPAVGTRALSFKNQKVWNLSRLDNHAVVFHSTQIEPYPNEVFFLPWRFLPMVDTALI